MELDAATVRRLAEQAGLALAEDELEQRRQQLVAVLSWAAALPARGGGDGPAAPWEAHAEPPPVPWAPAG